MGCAIITLWGCGSRTSLPLGEAPLEAPSAPVPQPSAPMQPSQPTEPPRIDPTPCEAVSLTIDELRPSVTLLVDQSGSMRESFPTRDSGQSRWNVVQQALLDPQAGVVSTLQSSIEFGLSFYTSYNGFQGGACPVLSEVPPATDNYEALRKLYDVTYPADDTPTGAAISQVVARLAAEPRPGPQVLLLVTDGDPDTCEQPDPQGGQQDAVDAAAQAFAAGIDFYVLGVSEDISGVNLQQLANAGRGKRLDARWPVDLDAAQPYQASASVPLLTQQLEEILVGIPLCLIELHRPVSAGEVLTASVTLDGRPLQLDAVDGYRQQDAQHLEILGAGCETLRSAGRRLEVRISCDPER
jgi:hypothetical protein